jgi:hypothetical protein
VYNYRHDFARTGEESMGKNVIVMDYFRLGRTNLWNPKQWSPIDDPGALHCPIRVECVDETHIRISVFAPNSFNYGERTCDPNWAIETADEEFCRWFPNWKLVEPCG